MNTAFRNWIQGFEPPMAMRWQSLSDSFVIKRTQFHVSRVPDPLQGSEWMDPEHCALKLELGRKGPVYRLQARGNDVVLVKGIKEVGLVQGNTPREFLAAVVALLEQRKQVQAAAEPSAKPAGALRLVHDFDEMRGPGPVWRRVKLTYRGRSVYIHFDSDAREGVVYFDNNDHNAIRFQLSLALVADEPRLLFRKRQRPSLPAVIVPQSRIVPGVHGVVQAIIKTAYDIAFGTAQAAAEPSTTQIRPRLRIWDELKELRGNRVMSRRYQLKYRNKDVYLIINDSGDEGTVYFDSGDLCTISFSLDNDHSGPYIRFRSKDRQSLPAVTIRQSQIQPGARNLVAAILKTAYDIKFPTAQAAAEPQAQGDVVSLFVKLHKNLLETPLRSKYKGKTFVAQARKASFDEISVSVGENTLTFKVLEDFSTNSERVVGLSDKLRRRGNYTEPPREHRIRSARSGSDLLRRMAEVVRGL